jgi:hypothetical protein
MRLRKLTRALCGERSVDFRGQKKYHLNKGFKKEKCSKSSQSAAGK